MTHGIPSAWLEVHWGEGKYGVQACPQMSMQFSLDTQCQVPYVSAWPVVPVVTTASAAGSTPDGPQALSIVVASAPTSTYFIMVVVPLVRAVDSMPTPGRRCR